MLCLSTISEAVCVLYALAILMWATRRNKLEIILLAQIEADGVLLSLQIDNMARSVNWTMSHNSRRWLNM